MLLRPGPRDVGVEAENLVSLLENPQEVGAVVQVFEAGDEREHVLVALQAAARDQATALALRLLDSELLGLAAGRAVPHHAGALVLPGSAQVVREDVQGPLPDQLL